MASRALLPSVVLAFGLLGCREERVAPGAPPTWHDGVGGVLSSQCVRCHGPTEAAGGWRADTYLGAIGCTASGASAVGGAAPPILTALDRPDHAGVATAEQRTLLSQWVAAGAPSIRGGVHDGSFADPRSPASHGAFLRSKKWKPMLDGEDADACSKCHEGGGTRPPGLEVAPGATACTTCHTEPDGVFACSTCHGDAPKAYPPRDACFFPTEPRSRIHAAHVDPSSSSATGLACATCHPQPLPGQFGGTHGDGFVEVWFDWAIAGNAAKFDSATKQCTGTCHARGGARPSPAWTEQGPLSCNDCHGSPPPAHYAGACTSCHREANAGGTALSAPALHVNGKVDLGDGSGQCGACHGQGDSPWPTTGAHARHQAPLGAKPVACETCHELPGAKHPVGTGAATVRLLGLAAAGGAKPSFDAQTKACAGTYCHAQRGATVATPRWNDGPASGACGACHSAPPPPPHSQGTTCATTTCHEGSTSQGTGGPELTDAGRAVHVNGVVDRRVQ